MEETRLRDTDGATSGRESSSLGLFSSYCGPASGRIGSSGKELGPAVGQVILRQEGRQRGPGGTLGESGIMAGWGRELTGKQLGEKTGTRAKCRSGKLKVGLCWAGATAWSPEPDCWLYCLCTVSPVDLQML